MRVLISGANRGIGLALCHLYHQQNHEVIAVCRQSSPELDQLGVELIKDVDQAKASVGGILKAAIGKRSLDLAILNSGILSHESLTDLDFERMRNQFEVNTLGTLRFAQAILDHLQPSSKIAIITSRMGSIADNSSGGNYGYRMSKAALNAGGKSLAVDLKPRQIAVAILHPGFVRTDMTGKNGQLAPEESALNLQKRIDELTLETSGSFWHSNGERLPW